MSFIAPYLHIELPKTSKVKVFGFRNLRSFMYAFGMPLSLFTCTSLFLYATSYIKEQKIKKIFLVISLMFNYTSIFHFVWIFWSQKDLPKGQYYLAISILSLVFVYTYYLFFRFRKSHVIKLQKALNTISHFAFIGVKKYIHPDKMEDYEKDSIQVLNKGRKWERKI